MRTVFCALSLFTLLAASCATRSGSNGGETPAALPPGAEAGAAPESQAGPGAPAIQEELERLTLAQQRQAFLVEQHLAQAKELVRQTRLEEAELELARALELDPDHLGAKEFMAEVGSLLGRPGGKFLTMEEILARQQTLRVQQLREEAKDNYRQATVHLARGEFDAAIIELGLCLDHIRWDPYRIDWEGLDQQAETLLAEAKTKRDEAVAAAQEESERAALSELRSQEQAEKDRREALIANLLTEAIAAFRVENYDQAIDYADRVIRLDPRNEKAKDIRDTAFRRGRDKVGREFLAKKSEQYKRWQEELADMRVPYNDVITLPDQERWREITEIRARRPGIDLEQAVDASELELRRQLATTEIRDFKIDEMESLTEVIDTIKYVTGLPLVVAPVAESAALDEGKVFDFDLTHPISVEEALDLITQAAGETITWTVRHDAVLITTKEKARGTLQIYNHDVQDLIFPLTDFMGPRIDRLRLIEEMTDEDGGSQFGSIGDKQVTNEPDDLVTLVRDNVAQGTWDQEGININIEGGNMIVVHTSEVQKQVRQFLEDLRRFSASLVTIETKFMSISDNFLQEIGVDFRGLDNPGSPFTDLDDLRLDDEPTLGLDNNGTGSSATPPSSGFYYDDGQDGAFAGRSEAIWDSSLGDALSGIGGLTGQWTFLNDVQLSAILRLVEKSSNIELINDQVLSVHNTQRAFVTVINQKAYIQDFDVEVAQFQAVADPVVNVLTEGIVLDVRPTIHHDRKSLTLEIQPTVARVAALTNFSTTLGGSTASVTFQLPELEVQSVFTTAVVPDGGSILIGGLSRLRDVERRAEVPWLAKIPVVGFFFKEEGYSDERESLMIMIRAWITDVKEELATLERR
ncbi:MAG: hypothetical protein AB1726_12545 [Planctomycetota bacterium]